MHYTPYGCIKVEIAYHNVPPPCAAMFDIRNASVRHKEKCLFIAHRTHVSRPREKMK